ncbi:hypothetical protein PR202_ga27549 [Eleusine coracana subsp. coracana]|uniref:MBD domain-containing protein n=1 Tax=Eleusine coracana subsp. coracana TaxID=191504 RepID=A0AAV5DFH3_ELECO|nr:hypothetical protein PR202_ga27549 [Eleusine coracana subsp. coracana]
MGVVRVDCIMDSGNSSWSKTRSGLVRANGIMDLGDGSCSRTRSGLVRRKSFMGSSDDSCSRTRSGLVRRKSFTGFSDDSCSRTRSGLVRRKSFMNSSNGSCYMTGNELVRGSPSIKAVIMGGPVTTELPDADGPFIEETPSRTRSGLIRQRPILKALGKDGSVTEGKDESVTEGLPDGWLKEYRPRPGSSQKNDPYYIDPVSGYEFRSLKDVHRYLRTGDIRQCAMRPKQGTLYDVCITESQTNTSISSQQTRPGTADKAIQCEILTSEGIMLPWEELFSPDTGKNKEHTMSQESEIIKTMERCVDKLETSQQNGFELFPAQCAPRQTESIKRKKQSVEVKSKKHRSEASPAVTPIRVSCRLAALNAQSEASSEPKDQPISVNPVNQLQMTEANKNCMAETSQSSTMNEIHGNEERTSNQLWSSQDVTVNITQAMQENTINHLQLSQVDYVSHKQLNQQNIRTNQGNTGHQLRSSLVDTDIPVRTVHRYSTDQPSQAETMNHEQTNMENAFDQLESLLADTLNHIEASQENISCELQSSLEDRVIPTRTMQDYTTASQEDTMNHVQMNLKSTANQLQCSLADTIVPMHSTEEFTSDHSQPSSADSMNQIQANQRDTADALQIGQAGTASQIRMMQNNMTNPSQASQANSLNQIHINLENANNHLELNYAENPLLQTGFSWAPEQNGGVLVTDFWRSFENQDSSVPMQIDGVPIASFPANVKFQSTSAAAAEPIISTTQPTIPVTASDQSGLAIPSLFGNAWSDPCIEFAFKTLTGDIPVLDDTCAVTDYFPQQQDLNKGTTPNCTSSAIDNSRTHTQIDVNLPLPGPSDKLHNGSWFPPQ